MSKEGRTAFVTGATKFVGLAVVEALLKHGWRVVVLTRSERSALAALKSVAGGEKVRIVEGDISLAGDMPGIVADLVPAETSVIFHLISVLARFGLQSASVCGTCRSLFSGGVLWICALIQDRSPAAPRCSSPNTQAGFAASPTAAWLD